MILPSLFAVSSEKIKGKSSTLDNVEVPAALLIKRE